MDPNKLGIEIDVNGSTSNGMNVNKEIRLKNLTLVSRLLRSYRNRQVRVDPPPMTSY